MKRKVFSLFTCVLLISSSLSMAPIAEDDGNSPSQCAQWARGTTLQFAAAAGEDPNGEHLEYWLSIYRVLYIGCLNG